jgi:hypothetical protein
LLNVFFIDRDSHGYLGWSPARQFLSYISRSAQSAERKTTKERSGMKCSKIASTTVLKTGCLKSWIPQPFCAGIPIEPIAKIVACGIGVFGETFLALLVEEKGMPRRLQFGAFKIFNSSGDFVHVGKFQHVTM